ncbi:MAG: hypothetical protein H6Q16_412 [Bacteroidetes bacterium]|nr:hypothetical protein [Bacteroidota bacterium]
MINIKTIWDSLKTSGDIIIKTRIDGIKHLNCFAATNNITGLYLYIMSVSNDVAIPELKNYRFKGVEIFTIENENNIELNIYLLDNELKDIFSLFIQNILEDVEKSITENEAVITTLNIISKWKKLFDKINFNGLNREQQKGLIGELLFFNYLLEHEKTSTSILNAWTGSDYKDKDFTFGGIGIEIKFTSSKNPKITISSERQLDSKNLNELFLLLFTAEEVKENGFSLNSLIQQIRKKITNQDELNLFNENLTLIGYMEDDKSQYNTKYSLKNTLVFEISEEFPKIIKNQLPLSIYDVKYSIELSAVEKYKINFEELFTKL